MIGEITFDYDGTDNNNYSNRGYKKIPHHAMKIFVAKNA